MTSEEASVNVQYVLCMFAFRPSAMINIDNLGYSGFINGQLFNLLTSVLDNECKEPRTPCKSGAL